MFNHGSDVRLTDRFSFYVVNSKDQVWPVGSLRPNEFGLFDTGGNVFEWSLESYDPYPVLNGSDVRGQTPRTRPGIERARCLRGDRPWVQRLAIDGVGIILGRHHQFLPARDCCDSVALAGLACGGYLVSRRRKRA
jgi:hypothetical protein